ncbi:MAG: protease pro-enzyme activation domain-containing protein, partial [Actinomycetota bacterium]|nr:protease pro-enzyme activation domain-containing protein [Actinomycetota bacterium]
MMRKSVGSLLALPALVAGMLVSSAGVGFAAGGPLRAPRVLSLFPTATLRGSQAPVVPKTALALGPIAPGRQLHLVVTLQLPKPRALQAFLAAVSDRSSPLFHHFLRPGRFGPRFGPSLAALAEVRSVLEREGLSVGRVSRDRLSISVHGSAREVESAFQTRIESYRLASGRAVFANLTPPRIPASASGLIEAVLGLDDVARQHSNVVHPRPGRGVRRSAALIARLSRLRAAAGPQPCPAAVAAASSHGTFTANQLAAYYAMTPLYDLGDFGQGVRVALAEFEPNLASDITAYQECYGTNAAVNYYEVDGGPGLGAGSGEATLDIEDVIGLAPGATIDVYQAANGSEQNVYDEYSAIVNADSDAVVSTSWGACELDSDPSLLNSEQSLFSQADAQGQTVFAAAGDTGSTDCLRDSGSPNQSSLSVDNPASQPYVVSVGGTSIGASSESVWNESAKGSGAGGGGVSAFWCMPAYQDRPAIPDLMGPYSVADPSGCASVSRDALVRQVPDVSADADPYTGYTVYFTGSGSPGWIPLGGTSAAAPLWAAAAALIDSSPFCTYYGSGGAGVLPAGLYQVASNDRAYIYEEPGGSLEALYDVQSGNNDYAPSGYLGGLFPAAPGYDMASGLGTPLLGGLSASGHASNFYPGLAALMCYQYATRLRTTRITKVSPAAGPAGRAVAVVITGSGFLPVAGADELAVGRETVVASCPTTSLCRAVLPAGRPGTVNLRMLVEDLAVSPVVSGDRF